MLGPTFGRELEAAGLSGLPITWGDDGSIEGREQLTAEQRAALDAVIAAHDPEARPPVVLPPISDRQFAHGLARRGMIPWEEARAFVKTGEIPGLLRGILDDPAFQASLPPTIMMDEVLLLIEGSTDFERYHPVTLLIIQAFGWDAAETDAFWSECLAL